MRSSRNLRRIRRGFVFTERDRVILRLVHDHRFLTRSHLQRLLDWKCTSRINLRLRALFDAQFLDRRFVPVLRGSSPAVYIIGKSAVATLSGESGVSESRLERHRHQDKRYSDAFMRHALAVSELAVAMRAVTHDESNVRWLTWLNDRTLIEECNGSVAVNGNTLKPDGYGRYAISDKVYNFFLELDTGSESISRIRRKLEYYRSFLASGAFRDRFGMRAFRVLIVTLTKRRAQSLVRALNGPERPRTWIGELAVVVKSPLFASAWYPVGRLQKVSLHDAPNREHGSGAA